MSLADEVRKSLAQKNAPVPSHNRHQVTPATINDLRSWANGNDPILRNAALNALRTPEIVDSTVRAERHMKPSHVKQHQEPVGDPCKIHGSPFTKDNCAWCDHDYHRYSEIEQIEQQMALDDPMNMLAITDPKLHADILNRFPDPQPVDTRKVLADIGAQALDLQRQVDEVKRG